MKILLYVISCLYFLQISAMTAEVDQFTRINEQLGDSTELLNLKSNEAIIQSIIEANSKNKGCSEKVLYKELRNYFSNHVQGKLIKDFLKNPDMPKRHIELRSSVYQDWTFWDGLGMGFTFLSKKAVTMSDVMKVADQEIGVDKLEHMFGQGFTYFQKSYLKKKGAESAIKTGIFKEKFLLGGQKMGNGVFSYGDLSANFNGMRFWNHMLQLRDDVLGEDFNIGPYITCENDKWVKAKEFDIRNYIDDSMNETINCSKFPTEKTADKFKERLSEMGVSCPIDQGRLENVILKYRHMSKWIINPNGPSVVKYFSEFKEKN